MKTYDDLANLIFPDINLTIDDLEKKYPCRNLNDDAMVTRFAPSPTGFLHTGSLFTSLISSRFAKQSGGVFYIRLEDTDTKREIEGSGESLLKQLKVFGVEPDEGYLSDSQEIGNYGPYKQSNRADIYKVVIKHLIKIGRAYPCFYTQEELSELRKKQEAEKVIPGVYGIYAKYRDLSADEAINKINNGDSYIIRFKSMGDHNNKIKFHDEIRGDLELTENDQDIVIYKSDGLPTYHFAHLVDDHFMRTTVVTRGEEWLPSLPIHLELFDTLGFKRPKYAHFPVIMKVENGNRRKLSKRKDAEAACSFFLEQGYPVYGFIEYLLTIANSNYEEWRNSNLDKDFYDFKLSFDKMSLDGALFDLEKVESISKERMAYRKASDLANEVETWAKEYNKEFYNKIVNNKDFLINILNIEREKDNPRKDYAKYSDIYPIISFFYDDVFKAIDKNTLDFTVMKAKGEFKEVDKSIIKEFLIDYMNNYNVDIDEESWFNNLKDLADKYKFTSDRKAYKANPYDFNGQVGDAAGFIRLALAGRKNTPNIYFVQKILGKEKVFNRINSIINNF
jgi:glutamyl-tRNA synthetase